MPINERLLVADEQLFRLIVQASPAGLLLVDGQGKIVLVSGRALEFFGYQEAELVGQPVAILIPAAHHVAHSEQMARYMSHPQTRTMAAGRDLFARRRDGSDFPVDISLHPLTTEHGTYILANILDATARRRAEREARQQHTLERLALLGQLAAGVAHEIRTPLCVIRNDAYYLQTLADQLGPEARECIEEINQAVGKADRIVSELLDFTRDPPSHLRPVLLKAILDEALANYPIPASVTFLPPDAELLGRVAVEADCEQISRVLINLFRNAVQAMQGSGTLSVTLSHDATHARLTVCDSGPGVAAEAREAIFEPLFTTKANGIGLGLSISQRYAQWNHGQLELLDSPHRGACFCLTLARPSTASWPSTATSPSVGDLRPTAGDLHADAGLASVSDPTAASALAPRSEAVSERAHDR